MSNSASDQMVRQSFRYLNRFMVLLWRLGIAPADTRYPDLIGQFVVLVHTGRKSGKRRQTPLNYALVDNDIYITAGFGERTDWFRNISANPQVEVWTGSGRWAARAEPVAPDTPGYLERLAAVLRGSGFAAVMADVDPRRLSAAELTAATADYRLVRLQRTAALTGPGGPGDLAWIWPWATGVLLVLLLLRRKSV
jgi:deazaflavin-dependent oxidoreductase (nitroreductase family)